MENKLKVVFRAILADDNRVFLALAGLILVALIFGGAPNTMGWRLMLTTFVSAVALASFIAWGNFANVKRMPRLVLVWLGLTLAIPLLQLVPLPPALWQSLPGREHAITVVSVIGADAAWRPLTLDPVQTKISLLALLPALAIFIGSVSLDKHQRVRLLQLVALSGVVSIAVGIFQVTSRGAWLNFYDTQHDIFLLGFFSNRNHAALLITSALLIATWLIWETRSSDRNKRALTIVLIIFALGPLLATFSRAGIGLYALSVVVILRTAFPQIRKIKSAWWLAGIVGLVLASVLVVTLSDTASRSLARFAAIEEDSRWDIWRVSWGLVKQYWPAGSGLGGFVPLYAQVEPLALLQPRFVNHAHNDYLEVVIEAGVLGLIAIAGVWVVVAMTGHMLLKGANKRCHLLLLVPVLTLLHSTIDYPLRTPAISCIASLCLAHCIASLLKSD